MHVRVTPRGGPLASRPSLPGDERGAVAVEFALLVVPLLVLVFGIINFGFVFSQQSTINNAVREGARRAVVNDPYSGASVAANPRTCDGIIASVHNKLAGLGMNPSDVQIKITQDGWTNSSACGAAFSSTTFGTSAAHQPCLGSFDSTTNTARSLIVEAKYPSNLPVAFPPFPTTLNLTSKAVYRCEFSY